MKKMVRQWIRKTTRASTPSDIILRAVREVKIDKKSIRSTAAKYEIPFRSLARYCSKIPEPELNKAESNFQFGYQQNRKVCKVDFDFSKEDSTKLGYCFL
ncbi:hypothetical protein NQ314_008038 [Rhamnusium bicolor]|uniref:HTH psq-type domain-containing protein n=1 Tax=Rhamnusium bicolor TaxID=1586634 RepID=A0AAV8YED3_9CUCU|nr:hypothetical protein NQ314_008038 [Rhamnusium bicolor]